MSLSFSKPTDILIYSFIHCDACTPPDVTDPHRIAKEPPTLYAWQSWPVTKRVCHRVVRVLCELLHCVFLGLCPLAVGTASCIIRQHWQSTPSLATGTCFRFVPIMLGFKEHLMPPMHLSASPVV